MTTANERTHRPTGWAAAAVAHGDVDVEDEGGDTCNSGGTRTGTVDSIRVIRSSRLAVDRRHCCVVTVVVVVRNSHGGDSTRRQRVR